MYAASIETGYSPEGTALQLVLKTIDSAQQEIRLMGYSFTSPEVAGALVRAKQRGLDVKVVLDWKANTGKQNQASQAAMNLLVNAGIPVRTVSQYKIMHDKVIIADDRNIEVGSFNYTRAAERVNSENVLVVWDVPVVAQRYLQHWQSRWNGGTDWHSSY
ncbi:TPA: phospholipase D family protein [Klebsiella pneumoniae]|nr:phospholipase D family protein [Klebsiella pneumoniae]MBE8895213.1 phospholipase D family protein [Klebsiella grimontii]NRG06321.1 phospholipase D family protein [Klebsiella variicola]ULJ36659.1 phospholipase D family protein [Klebsiella quasipneumoniae]HAN3366307.1 phospholipase D family protein [Escherichia coli]HBQ5892839.1 phospholipase D family protein [Klebsiella variicola subsp. variicola]HBQ6721070.1 phospholipase D family protein [Klebsiella quasipneumoniae subsp. similipneumoniae